MQLLTAGYDKVDVVTAAELNIPVATNGGANAEAVAEHAFALMLALYRKLSPCDASVRAGTWRKPADGFNTFELSGKTVGIIGAGNIGQRIARRLNAFETDILYHDALERKELEESLGARRAGLEEILRTADIITLHAPLLDSTRGMIGANQLGMMKRTGILINTSRAELVNEDALVAALRGECIAGHSLEGWSRRARTSRANIQKVAAGGSPDFMIRVPARS